MDSIVRFRLAQEYSRMLFAQFGLARKAASCTAHRFVGGNGPLECCREKGGLKELPHSWLFFCHYHHHIESPERF